MDLTSFANKVAEINTHRTERMVNATQEYITEMRAIVSEAEVATQLATAEMLGEDAGSNSVNESAPQELARGLFT